jgi:2,4-dienoyl-CoA reductase-like NADH-dependent reductase (Old Yellow Enzyme family)/NADPH-dependent 2,4-dienoyl-CoA reductase/sulfur reductase-like enzyme
MEKLVKLFEPGNIGTMQLKNRLLLSPLGGMSHTTEPGGYVTEELLDFYGARAKGGVGLVQLTVQCFSNAIYGLPAAYSGPQYGHGLLSIEDDAHIPGARLFTKMIHDNGAKVSCSVAYFGRKFLIKLKQRNPEASPSRVLAPSAIKEPFTGLIPHALTVNEIREIVEASGEAAKRGKAAGFDALRIQGAHGYGIHQFLSPRTNQRKDEYGGTLLNRCRFGCEVIRSVRKAVGPDFPIIIRINGSDFMEDGITLNDAIEHAQIFVEAGVDALDISAGARETHHWENMTMYQPFGPLVHLAAAMKKQVKVPIITTAKLTPLLGERILQEGSADFIQMGRPLIADPELPKKAKEGRLEDIRPCIWCNQCLERDKGVKEEPESPRNYCAVNPVVGKELECKKLASAVRSKNVIVIGGGLAGMEAAVVLAERGHKACLYENADNLGGQWNLVSAFKPDLNNLIKYLTNEMKRAGVDVFLNKEIIPQEIQELKPDAVVVATGSVPVVPDVPGINGKNVVMATDVLAGKVDVGQEVVIVGGRYVGLDAALFLAARGNKKISVIETKKIGWGLNHRQRFSVMENLIKYDVRMYPDSTLESITECGVNVLWDGGEPVVKSGRFMFYTLKADTVVLATGSRPEKRLYEQLSSVMPEVYAIGDCVQPRTVLAAIHEGWTIGNKI